MKAFKRGLLIGITFMLILSLIPNLPAQATGEPILQVALKNYLGNVKEITLNPEVDYSTNLGDTKLIAKQSYRLVINNGNIVLLKGTSEIGRGTTIDLQPLQGNGPISINNRPYLGTFRFVIESGILGRLTRLVLKTT